MKERERDKRNINKERIYFRKRTVGVKSCRKRRSRKKERELYVLYKEETSEEVEMCMQRKGEQCRILKLGIHT